MFNGEYHNKMDAKGRIGIPVRMREVLAAESTLAGRYRAPEGDSGEALGRGLRLKASRGFENCVWVFTEDAWRKTGEALAGNPMTDRSLRALQRFFMGSVVDVEIDAAGRILIPQPLREYAGLERECVVVGVGEKIEVWARGKWDGYCEEFLDSERLTHALEARGAGQSHD